MGVPTYGAIILDETLENVSTEIAVKGWREGWHMLAEVIFLLLTFFHLEQKINASASQRPDSYLTLLSVYRSIWETINTLSLGFYFQLFFFSYLFKNKSFVSFLFRVA